MAKPGILQWRERERRWSDADKTHLVALAADPSVTFLDAAIEFQRSVDAVRKLARRMGLVWIEEDKPVPPPSWPETVDNPVRWWRAFYAGKQPAKCWCTRQQRREWALKRKALLS